MKNFSFMRYVFIMALALGFVLTTHVAAYAKDAPTSYRLLPKEGYKANALMDWEGKKRDEEDDFFGDSAPVQPKADPCKGEAIIGKINCDVTDTMKKSGEGASGSQSSSSESTESTGAKPQADLKLELVPDIEKLSGNKFKVKLVAHGNLTKENEPSIEERLDLDNDEKKVKDAVKVWEKTYTKDELEKLVDQRTLELNVSELFQDTKLLKLKNKPVLKLDILPEPRLAAVYVIGDQSGHAHLTDDLVSDEEEINTNKYGTAQTRNLAVYMKDYDSTRDSEPVFTGEGGVSYTVIGTKGGVQDGRTDYKLNMEHLKPKAPSGPAGTELVLVRAKIKPNTHPGFKIFKYQGQANHWPFIYSDVGVRVEVARQNPQGYWEPVSYALIGDEIRLQYHLTQNMDLGSMPILFAEGNIKAKDSKLKTALKNGKTYQAEKMKGGYIYATKPFFLMAENSPTTKPPEADDADDSRKIILKSKKMVDRELAYLVMAPDPDFTREKLLGAYAPGNGFVKIPVRVTPPQGTLWKDALKRAAQCESVREKLNGADWDQLPAQEKEKLSRVSVHSMAYSVGSWLWNGNSIDLNPSSQVLMGHHAAFLLMRDNTLVTLKNMSDRFDDISQDIELAKKYYINLPNFRFPKDHPLQLTKVRMPDGEKDGYAEIMQSDAYLKEKYDLNDETLMEWRVDATQQAAGEMVAYIDNARKQIRDSDACKTEELMRVLGDMYGVAGAITKNSLVKNITDREDKRDYWVSDEAARHWVDSAIYLSKEVAARNREADMDTMALKAQLMAVTLVGAVGSGAPLATDVLGLGVTGFDMVGNIKKYMDVGRDRELAYGKAAVLGAGYYRKQEAKALTTQKFVVQMMLDSFGMAMDGYSALNHLSRIWKARFFETPVKPKDLTQEVDEIMARIDRDAERALNPRLLDTLDAAPTRSWDEALNNRPEWRELLSEMRVNDSYLNSLNPDVVKALEDIVPELKGRKALDAALFENKRGLNNAEIIVGKAWEANMSPSDIMAKTGMDMEEYSQALSGYLRKGQKLKDPDKIMQVVEDSFDAAKREARIARMKENNPAFDETAHHPAPVDVHAKTQPHVSPEVKSSSDASEPVANNNAPVPHNNADSLQKALESRGYNSIEDAGLTPDMLRKMEEMSKGDRVNYDQILDNVSMGKAVKIDDDAIVVGHAFSQGRDPVDTMRKYNLSEDDYRKALKDYLIKKEKISANKADQIVSDKTNPESMKQLYEKHKAIDEMLHGKSDPRLDKTYMEESLSANTPAFGIKPGEAVVPAQPIKADLDGEGTAISPPPVPQLATPSGGPGVVHPNQAVRGLDANGKPAEIELGDHIDDGYYNMIYDVKRAAGETPVIARISKAPATDDGIKLDGFGRRALEDVDSSAVRAIERESVYTLDGGRQAEIIKKVDEFAHQQIAKNPDGRMTDGQAIAFDKATRALNKKGYVWLDNHHKNYYFEKVDGTNDEWRVVISDTGGVFKVKDIKARDLQKIVSSPDQKFLDNLDVFPKESGIREALIRGRSEDMRIKFKDNFDLDAMGIKDFDVLQFRSDGVAAYPKARELFSVDTDPKAAYEALRAKSP